MVVRHAISQRKNLNQQIVALNDHELNVAEFESEVSLLRGNYKSCQYPGYSVAPWDKADFTVFTSSVGRNAL